MKFKVGDKVKIIATKKELMDIKIGKSEIETLINFKEIYTITKIMDDTYIFGDKNCPYMIGDYTEPDYIHFYLPEEYLKIADRETKLKRILKNEIY